MSATTLSLFPALLRCSKVTTVDFNVAYIGELLRLMQTDEFDCGLSEIDATLETLLTRFTVADLDEQIQDLFCSDPQLTRETWEKTSTELYALSCF